MAVLGLILRYRLFAVFTFTRVWLFFYEEIRMRYRDPEICATNAPDNDSSSLWQRRLCWSLGLLLGAWGDQSACSRRSCENRL
jgi:hypothetical protein